MTEIENVVYIQANIAQAMIRAFGMQAENRQREVTGCSPAYVEADFINLINEYRIHDNAIIGSFQDVHRYD